MFDVDLAVKLPQAADQATDGLGLVAPGEVIGTEVAIRHAVTQHVVACPQHGGRNGEDRLLGAAARFEAEKLSLEIADLPPVVGAAWKVLVLRAAASPSVLLLPRPASLSFTLERSEGEGHRA